MGIERNCLAIGSLSSVKAFQKGFETCGGSKQASILV